MFYFATERRKAKLFALAKLSAFRRRESKQQAALNKWWTGRETVTKNNVDSFRSHKCDATRICTHADKHLSQNCIFFSLILRSVQSALRLLKKWSFASAGCDKFGFVVDAEACHLLRAFALLNRHQQVALGAASSQSSAALNEPAH